MPPTLAQIDDFPITACFDINVAFPSLAFFAISFNPFISHLASIIDDQSLGCTRACADDLGVALRRIAHLPLVQHVLQHADALADLSINLDKTKLIPHTVCL